MEPVRPEVRKKVLEKKDVTEADIDEYQWLQALTQNINPDVPMSPGQEQIKNAFRIRLDELHTKLFKD